MLTYLDYNKKKNREPVDYCANVCFSSSSFSSSLVLVYDNNKNFEKKRELKDSAANYYRCEVSIVELWC